MQNAINMKKYLLTSVLAATIGTMSYGQISQGGVPYSFTNNSMGVSKTLNVSDVNVHQWKFEEEEAEKESNARPYMVARNVDYPISFDDGTFITHKDGSVSWLLEINVPDAAGIDVFFNQLVLKPGVTLYAYGKNKKQILGAYTSESAIPSKTFILGPIIGSSYTIEFHFENVKLVSATHLDIPTLSVYFRGLEEDAKAYGLTEGASFLFDSSASCNVDANCNRSYDGWETSQFEDAKNASARIVVSNGGTMGLCSGTLVTATDYSSDNCNNLFLTASHCDGGNGRTDEHFDNWRFYFNYEHTECEGSNIAYQFRFVQGAKFLARSNYPSGVGNTSGSAPGLVQDFLALDLTTPIPETFDIARVGWNRRIDIAEINQDYSTDDYKFFIGFHHPGGNPKKQSISGIIHGNGTFNQFTVPATHWSTNFAIGCTEGGSSGSGLFDQNGNIIGVLSGGAGATAAQYSKISYGWENEWEQGKFEPYSGAVSRLKEWLDPLGTNQEVFFGTDATCSTVTIDEHDFSNNITIFPNPVNSGNLTIKFDEIIKNHINVSLVDVMGKTLHQKEYHVGSGSIIQLDVQQFATGIYFVVMESNGQKSTQKVVINN